MKTYYHGLKVYAEITEGEFKHPEFTKPVVVYEAQIHIEYLCGNCDDIHHTIVDRCIFNEKKMCEFWADVRMEEVHIETANAFKAVDQIKGIRPVMLY